MSKKTAIVLAGNTISLTREPTANNISDLINKATVTTVSGVFNKKPGNGEISHGAVTGSYTLGETITGGTSGATAILVAFKNTIVLSFSNIMGIFIPGETLTGATSSAVSTSSSAVTPTSYSGEWKYPYPTMTILQIEMNDGSKVSIELQDVSNQSAWSDGTLAGLQAAEADVNAFL